VGPLDGSGTIWGVPDEISFFAEGANFLSAVLLGATKQRSQEVAPRVSPAVENLQGFKGVRLHTWCVLQSFVAANVGYGAQRETGARNAALRDCRNYIT